MKMFKKMVSMAIAVGIAATCFSFNSYASEMSALELVRKEVIDEYCDDYMFQQMSVLDPGLLKNIYLMK